MDGKAGSTLLLHNVPGTLCDRVLLIGLGKEKEFHEKAFGAAVRTAVKMLNETGALEASIFLTEIPVRKRDIGWRVRQAAMIALEATLPFRPLQVEEGRGRAAHLRKLTFCVERRTELAAAEQA